jgi:hypothetical protein
MNTTVTFKGCAHLDFDPHYTAKRQLTNMGLFWLRDQEPSMVQFCKLKGRLYGCQACLSESNKQCNSYEEIEHNINLPTKEIQ